jgi:hypothetical protein
VFKRLLSAELKVWHLLLVVALLTVTATTTLAGQRAGPTRPTPNLTPETFFTTGAFNMAGAYSNTSQTVHALDGEVEVLREAFTIPAGQTAEIAAFFNAEAYKYANGYCYLTFYLDAIGPSKFRPGELWVADGYVYAGGYPTISAQGFKGNIAAGAHSVIVTLHATGGDCYVDDRTLIVISNRHA